VNLDAVELRIALPYHVGIPVLKYPLPEASQSMHYSANNDIADDATGAETFWRLCIVLIQKQQLTQ
jgi:hypothetical protein